MLASSKNILCVALHKNVMASEIVRFGGLNYFLVYLE
jgi:hypothetical protein